MSPEVKKIQVDKVCGTVANIVHDDLSGMDARIREHVRTYLNQKKCEGKIGPKVFVKISFGVNIIFSDADVPGPDGVQERYGQPHMITIT